ncbi:outer membrane porin, OprD family [Pseudomonas kribbensis]|uniref:Outer membrane porin, OprD family n=2 Tax=Pseudomonas kribbensis TaxID=1628086 RepID=A0A345RNZ7_9PSED|nr:outer membrane porin, OprD family [Pseudomonas kribbensis]
MTAFIHSGMRNGLSTLAGTLLLASLSHGARADFLADSHASFETRNVYFNRDFRDGPSTLQSKREEWAQGLMFRFESGFTPGVVGFGVDLLGMVGVRLDSSPDRAGSGLLPVRSDGRAASEYGKLGVTAKVKFSKTEVKAGSLFPVLPTLRPQDGMILPQTFRGALVTSQDLPGVVLTAGQLDRVKGRNDTSYEPIALNNKNNRFVTNAQGAHLNLVGVDRQVNEHLKVSYHYASLSDVYDQHFIGLTDTRPMAGGTVSSDLRFFSSESQGAAKAGKIHNQSLNGMVGYAAGGHKVSVGYQAMFGESAFPYVEGSDAYLVNYAQIGDFAEAKERSWQMRYDFDFERLGIPGLTFMSRYIDADHAQVAGKTGQEWERNTEMKYVIQSGTFKDVALRVRNATYRSSFSRDADETRILITYTKALW